MAAPTITYTDDVGSATLTFLGHLNDWNPDPESINDVAIRLGDGTMDVFEFRDARRVTFNGLVLNTEMAELERLQLHLLRGGECTVNTADSANHSYANCGLIPGQRPRITRADPATLDYRIELPLEYKGGTPVPFECWY